MSGDKTTGLEKATSNVFDAMFQLLAERDAALSKLEDIKKVALTADGWEDGETFYRSAIESIRILLSDEEEADDQ